MLNPFSSHTTDSPELEHQAAEFFRELSAAELSQSAAQSIRQSMLAALATTTRSVVTHRRLAFAGSAVVAPLLIVGAAGAATGESPLEASSAVLEAAVASAGIGGNSGDVRQDFDVRSETAGDVGQPGSAPGNTANAPGLKGDDEDEDGGDSDTDENGSESDAEEPSGDEASDAGEEGLPPHENGKGCDDVLFAEGEPPFASPGGPVGCEVGNSADHRQNGVKQADDDEEEPKDGPAGEPADVPEDDEGQGGTSHGLGLGHEEDKPGNGNGFGHTIHAHDPNPNGHGPGGPSDEDLDDDETPMEPEALANELEPVVTAPGKSGEAKGKNK